ncbi:type IV toxin-antitoxin system AbiEi family antitoxin domain-containing protein (plasmid) [Phyllobacterium sp. A18/5-2]|uniref:type IV toxin-antitoxin system AbiEi family antitoxin domain-containing protein n=1 Tax=Phyllobacterium sp. A18/5-2 TaxID=2978392 RepID=UPI0021C6B8FE|nr:type IV toxin-antitoxin system AbiEi family antitoxin domain-containing protein [Phyllobacterium sp. A18/5-2]UXN67063.1 type IV toxin-antitoxin system AbiEi family antitoxin domain-containing protein [Phyllobacterium sp. A18/5-2]
MEQLSEAIIKQVKKSPEGKILTAKDFLHLGNRSAADKTLSRLALRGEVVRVARGMYVAPIKGKFGQYLPSPEKVVKSYAKRTGYKILPTGASAANNLGMTTQVPVRSVFLTSGKNAELKLGKRTVELRHAPRWQTHLPGTIEGEAIRAISHSGKRFAKEYAVMAKKKLGPSNWERVLKLRSKLPGWMIEAITEADHIDR